MFIIMTVFPSRQCVLSVSTLLAEYSDPLFYDIFVVQQKSTGDSSLLAVPTLNLILQYNGQFVNQGDADSTSHNLRRFITL